MTTLPLPLFALLLYLATLGFFALLYVLYCQWVYVWEDMVRAWAMRRWFNRNYQIV